MTCIVGFVEDGNVYLGADSAGVAGYSATSRSDAKVFRNGPIVFGFTSSFRMGQLLRYALHIPVHHSDVDDYKYLVTEFVDAVRACLKAGGWAVKENENESGGFFLIGYKGHLYQIEGDYQVAESMDGFDACGAGQDIARGALFAVKDLKMTPHDKLTIALKAAERFCIAVRGPFVFEELIAPTVHQEPKT